jgi:hypothetical protein
MIENLCKLFIKGSISNVYKKLKKLTNKRPNKSNNKWETDLTVLKRNANDYYTHKEMFNPLSYKQNANHNVTEIQSHPSQNSYQGYKQ